MTAIKLHSTNLFYLGVCALGLAAFAMVGIVPNLTASRELDEETAQIEEKIQVQEQLYPIYMELIKLSQQKAPNDLPLPPPEKIRKNSISDLNARFAKLATASRVVFENAIPDPISYQEDTGRVTMNVAFSGDFFNFRKLLMNICQIPSLHAIEEMDIAVEGNEKRIRLKLLIDQE